MFKKGKNKLMEQCLYNYENREIGIWNFVIETSPFM